MHYFRHLVSDIILFGVPTNFSGHTGESNFKFTGKNLARRTQKRSHLLDQQTAVRAAEYTTIARGVAECSDTGTAFFGGQRVQRAGHNADGRKGMAETAA